MTDPRPRLILHPGFHQTGTGSIQSFLVRNRAALPGVTVLTPAELDSLVAPAHRFARTGDPLALSDLRETLLAVLAGLPAAPGDLILSAADLCGLIPGIRAVQSYAAAPALVHHIAQTLTEARPGHALSVILTTRAPEDWLFSAFRRHLRHRRLVLKRSEFETIFQGAPDFGPVIDQIGAALPGVGLTTLPLETAAAHPLGPGGAFAELAGLRPAPGHHLVAVPPVHADPAVDRWIELYRLNRRVKPDPALDAAKRRLMAAASPEHSDPGD